MKRFTTEWALNVVARHPMRIEPLAPDARWEQLPQRTRDNFQDEADWREVRRLAQGGRSRPAALVALDDLCTQLNLRPIYVYELMAKCRLPLGFLFRGEWKYNLRAPDVRALAQKAHVVRLENRH